MEQHKKGNTICSRQWDRNTFFYVANVPGSGGFPNSDWEYTTERAKAMPLNQYFVRRFKADCARVGATSSISAA